MKTVGLERRAITAQTKVTIARRLLKEAFEYVDLKVVSVKMKKDMRYVMVMLPKWEDALFDLMNRDEDNYG